MISISSVDGLYIKRVIFHLLCAGDLGRDRKQTVLLLQSKVSVELDYLSFNPDNTTLFRFCWKQNEQF